ncbi:MAG TPA: bifunctional UDP-N-acetylglucosamine diphosphorylase/glucosamine-1-phosphate N-acetyltransferase GlmU [Alphaproteobacteria bacterium]|nr:bifunctional UDP-N-acetylglucosamine diphosphorylase/glucosamine-1-phosphate N-acetyltransferase GlmU [Alphaproteobacteria bacterium]
MTKANIAAVILAAGKGTRMKSACPKVLHPIAGQPMVRHLLSTVERLNPARIAVVIGPDMNDVAAAVAPHPAITQHEQLGTAHAALAAIDTLRGFAGDVLVLYADSPLITQESLERLLAVRRAPPYPAVVVLGFRPADPAEYGRLVIKADGALERIVEFRDANAGERAITLCNSGVMSFDGARIASLLGRIGNSNAKKEYYLTDAVGLARAEGLACAYVEAPTEELLGINSRAELAAAEATVQRKLRAHAMANGASMTAPETVWLSHDTRLGQDVSIGPNVVFGPGVVVADHVEIRAFCHIEGAHIESGAVIGPFARLRPGAAIGENAHIGNFVEVKNAKIGEGAKANHLTYLGDARVGAGANVGAGTITCNYDGFSKYETDIGAGAFIGSNAALVAPVKIGRGAIVGAGSVITRDVAPDALALERARQGEVPNWAANFRAQKEAESAGKESAKKKTKRDSRSR